MVSGFILSFEKKELQVGKKSDYFFESSLPKKTTNFKGLLPGGCLMRHPMKAA